ncbi:hypothetical protein BC834DRAFT_77907 [Gloeopeniophorella convolvens]|nr:hypothetical protein BC834DRAFT_77907 [Gloeopeniophorella convolvens]
MVVAQTHKDAARARSDIQQMLADQEAKNRENSRIKLWKWLSPPNVSTDHELARGRHHPGTARWFLRDDLFEVWKREGSLFWINGKPGSGKTILSFAIIEELSRLRPQDGVAMVAYFYFSFQDAGKHSLRNLLSSLVMQLSLKSDNYYDVLAKLYESAPRLNGSKYPDPPTTSALSRCLREMLELPGTAPKYIIVDALDECPLLSQHRALCETRPSNSSRNSSSLALMGCAYVSLAAARTIFGLLSRP